MRVNVNAVVATVGERYANGAELRAVFEVTSEGRALVALGWEDAMGQVLIDCPIPARDLDRYVLVAAGLSRLAECADVEVQDGVGVGVVVEAGVSAGDPAMNVSERLRARERAAWTTVRGPRGGGL